MAIVEYQRAVVGPLAKLNEKLKNGVGPSSGADAGDWDDVKRVAAAGDWKLIGEGFDSGQIDHIKEHWLGVGGESWFPGHDTAKVLQKGFVHALSIAGERPVASVWVPSESATDVAVSVVENPTSIVVVLTSPMPPKGAEVAPPDPNVTTFSSRDGS